MVNLAALVQQLIEMSAKSWRAKGNLSNGINNLK